MKKIFFCISLALTGLMTGCIDKNELVDADEKPSWLGGSIYQELKNPQYLEGTFSNYLRLIDDLGYAETLNRTGSKTVFPANDEAFQRFFQTNKWGVTSYEQLSTAQKKMLLYNSMLDNALLVGMLSNTSGPENVMKGIAMKHQTSLSVTDTIQHILSADQMPKNNHYWDKLREAGQAYVVSDATNQMLVHFTREHMLANDITTLGEQSDFAILTGTPYEEGMAYIFDDQIVKSDITCQNGYIHQVKNVIVPPGNMAQVLHDDAQTSYFSRILDYYSAPFENQTVTNSYNAMALDMGREPIDMIYEVRYLNTQSEHKQTTDPDGNIVDQGLLNFDPGWNEYSPRAKSNGVDYTIGDVATMFVPTDEAVEKFFLQGGDGAYLIDLYGDKPNTAENLNENLDSLQSKRPDILTDFLRNLMRASFAGTVPSKFRDILSDASEYMGITLEKLNKKSDGQYDIKFANNGVIYKMTELIGPDKYQSVMAPATVYPDMLTMNWAVNDDNTLGVSHHYYLMAMKSKFAFFIPDDAAFERYYIDPIYLGHAKPRALKFAFYRQGTATTVNCVAYDYDPVTNTVGEVQNSGASVPVAQWKSLMVDILNYHTVVLDSTEVFGNNNYYKTKHGGELRITGNSEGSKVMSGQQIDNGIDPATITKVYNEKNGTAFRIDHVIEAPRNSVNATLRKYDRFSEFLEVCGGFSDPELLTWAGISGEPNEFNISEQDSYVIFTSDRRVSKTETINQCCLDENVKMFNTYNYTLYAPNNEAMKKAYAAGLPSWSSIRQLYEENLEVGGEKEENAKQQAKEMIMKLRDFARYHFQSTSVYADNIVESRNYNSLSTDALGLAIELRVSGKDGKLNVTDASGVTHTIDANNASTLSNMMARDYWFDAERSSASSIYTSSFCVVHEITEPLNSGNLGLKWASRQSKN